MKSKKSSVPVGPNTRKTRRRSTKKSKKKSNKSALKGGAFERHICRQLSLWVSHGAREDLFWRSAMSGGRATIALHTSGTKLKAQAGDISLIDPEGAAFINTFCVDCKHYKNMGLDNLLFFGPSVFLRAWKDLRKEATSFDKQPLLIAKQNRKPILVALPLRMIKPSLVRKVPHVILKHSTDSICILTLEQFIQLEPEKVLKETL